MFNKKNLLAALLLLSTAGGLVACGEQPTAEPTVDNEFEQNTDESMFEEASMYVIGSHWNNWDPGTIKEAEGCAFTKSATIPNCLEIDIVVTEEMLSGWVGFKFIASNSWNAQYGMEDVDFTKSNEAFTSQYPDGKGVFTEGTSNRCNIEPKLAGTYHVEYYPLNFDNIPLDNGNSHSNKFVITYTA